MEVNEGNNIELMQQQKCFIAAALPGVLLVTLHRIRTFVITNINFLNF